MNQQSSFVVRDVDFFDQAMSDDFLELLNQYSLDEMGSGKPLPDEIRSALVPRIQETSNFHSAICYDESGAPAGLVNFMDLFSTFAAKPLINIHDLVVHKDFRGRSVSRMLVEHVQKIASEKDCCKLTLEVLAENTLAKKAYANFGFEPYRLTEGGSPAEFWQKKI